MKRLGKAGLTRRDMLGLSAKGAGLFALSASGLAVPKGFAGGGGGGNIYVEAFPTSPVIVNPFTDDMLVPQAAIPVADPANMKDIKGNSLPRPSKQQQDVFGPDPKIANTYYNDTYQTTIGTHQIWPDELGLPDPKVYHVQVKADAHAFTTSKVQPIDSFGKPVVAPGAANNGQQYLPKSTIWGFNGTFPGPRINAEYGQPALLRFENALFEEFDGSNKMGDFGSPVRSFLTHLHNGHTAPESDGNPHYAHHRFSPMTDRGVEEEHARAAFMPGEWIDQLYLGYPAGAKDDPRNALVEKQSFFWFHDHVHGHTGANVYKGMVGMMPLYDPDLDPGDERRGLGLPGRRHDHDGTFDVDYDIPMALYDCRLDDGVCPHKDFHNGDGKPKPEMWGKTYFRHFPNHGFVGDIFTVNGTAYPVLRVKRRKYRLRFLDASISRIYELQLMSSKSNMPKAAAKDLGYKGDDLQGQWRLPDGQQCMKWVQIANEGGLLPNPIYRDSFEVWPAKRKEFVVDFSQYMDGHPTSANEVVWLVNTMKMTTGRMWDSKDPNYKVPLVKIIIEGDAPKGDEDTTVLGGLNLVKDRAKVEAYPLRPAPDPVPGWQSMMKGAPTFELQRGSAAGQPETEWLINGLSFDPTKPMISVTRDSGAVWRIRNGGGGWVHPLHLHMEEHLVMMRNGKRPPTSRHPDDTAKEDVIALDPSEDTYISRRFRTFTGPYVAHCHNLAHEDHNMMFGWDIRPPK